MMISGPWVLYTPKDKIVDNAFYLSDPKGNDWYLYRKAFKENTYKLVYFKNGDISVITTDVHQVFPVDAWVVELDSIPEGMSTYTLKQFRFDGVSIIPRVLSQEEAISLNTKTRDKLIAKAATALSPLLVLAQVDTLSDIKQKRKDVLVAYIRALNAIDVVNPTWPERPSL